MTAYVAEIKAGKGLAQGLRDLIIHPSAWDPVGNIAYADPQDAAYFEGIRDAFKISCRKAHCTETQFADYQVATFAGDQTSVDAVKKELETLVEGLGKELRTNASLHHFAIEKSAALGLSGNEKFPLNVAASLSSNGKEGERLAFIFLPPLTKELLFKYCIQL